MARPLLIHTAYPALTSEGIGSMNAQDTLEREKAESRTPLTSAQLKSKILRKVARTRFAGRVTYQRGGSMPDSAMAKNLGHGDISLELDHFLPPGETIRLELDCLRYRGRPIPVEAEVASCRRAYDRHCFTAIVQMEGCR